MPIKLETTLQMYLWQVWFSLSDEGVGGAIYDSHAMRKFMGLDFTSQHVPEATTVLASRHLLEEHKLGDQLFAAQNPSSTNRGMIGGGQHRARHHRRRTVVDEERHRHREMHQTKKGYQ